MKKAKQVKRPPRVQLYFGTSQMQVYKDLQDVANATGLSVSEVAYAGLSVGFYEVKDALLKAHRPLSKKVTTSHK